MIKRHPQSCRRIFLLIWILWKKFIKNCICISISLNVFSTGKLRLICAKTFTILIVNFFFLFLMRIVSPINKSLLRVLNLIKAWCHPHPPTCIWQKLSFDLDWYFKHSPNKRNIRTDPADINNFIYNSFETALLMKSEL